MRSLRIALVLLAVLAAPAGAADRADVPEMLAVARADLGPGCPNLVDETSVSWVAPGAFQDGRDLATHGRVVGRGGACWIALDSGYWREATWEEACTLLEHEYGHAVGLVFPENPSDPYHSPDPGNVMYARNARSASCATADPAYRLMLAVERLDRRLARRERLCLRVERRRGAAPRCWRVYDRLDGRATRLWYRWSDYADAHGL